MKIVNVEQSREREKQKVKQEHTAERLQEIHKSNGAQLISGLNF